MAWFNFQLVGVTDEMKRATGEAAEAAKQSAKATEAALHVNRPFLIVAMPEMKGVFEKVEDAMRYVPKCVLISVENFGTGPADIIDICAYIVSFDPPTGDRPDTNVQYRIEDRLPPYVPILGAGKKAEIVRQFFDIGRTSDVLAVLEETKRLGVYGEIRYRGGPPDEIYLTHFFWWYFPGPKGQDFSRAFTKELNSRT